MRIQWARRGPVVPQARPFPRGPTWVWTPILAALFSLPHGLAPTSRCVDAVQSHPSIDPILRPPDLILAGALGRGALVTGLFLLIAYLLSRLMWRQDARAEDRPPLLTNPEEGRKKAAGEEANLPPADEQSWLLDGLAQLIAERGSETFLEAPLLEPTPACFPDPFTRDLTAVHALTRRLLHYADLSDLQPQVQAYWTPDVVTSGGQFPAGRHTGAIAWFAGIEAGQCRFGVRVDSLGDDELLVGTMCHEVAHAWRCHHGIMRAETDLEECLTDLTTVYLGFGILTTNTAYRYRQRGELIGYMATLEWSHAGTGYLGPKALGYLLAAQVMARGMSRGERRSVRRRLEPNQADYFAAACKQLEADTSLARRLGLPASGPRPAKTIPRPAPLPVAPPQPSEGPGHARLHFNAGSPTFRVRRTQAQAFGLLGLIGGIIAGGVVFGASGGTRTALLAGIAISVGCWIAGLWRGHSIRWDYCSDPDCRFDLAPDLVMCPGCGGSIRGEIGSPHERFEAAERLNEVPEYD